MNLFLLEIYDCLDVYFVNKSVHYQWSYLCYLSKLLYTFLLSISKRKGIQ